jgi:plastocyanin
VDARFRHALLPLALLLAAEAFPGTISGHIQITEKSGKPSQDLADTVLYVQGAKAKPRPINATMEMKGKAFLPHVLVIPVGTTVAFPNDDPIFHNVFSLSENNHFDLDLYKRPKSGSWTFAHAGIARVYCNIHPQMSGVIVVVESSFFAKAGLDGTFTIEGIPAGSYTLSAWHERGGEASQGVKVAPEGDTRADLVLDATQFKKKTHLDKFGRDYSTHDANPY